MADKEPKEEQKKEDGSKPGLYPTSKKKIITPISVKQPDEDTDEKTDQTIKAPEKEKVIEPTTEPEEDAPENAVEEPNSAETVQAPETEAHTSDEKTEEEKPPQPNDDKQPDSNPVKDMSKTTAEEDPEANTVEADSKKQEQPEFIDQGQYHITVPKSANKKGKKSSFGKTLLMVILLLAVVGVGAYFYIETFNVEVDYDGILDNIKVFWETIVG